jgi:hypothetical protein
MSRFSISGRATIAGTSRLPLVSLYATTAVRPKIVEVSVQHDWRGGRVCACSAHDHGHAGRGSDGGLRRTDASRVAVATGFAGHTLARRLAGRSTGMTLALRLVRA